MAIISFADAYASIINSFFSSIFMVSCGVQRKGESMKKLLFLGLLVVLAVNSANAAGTYYTGGGYQSPQQRYNPYGTSPTAYNPQQSTYQRPTTAQIPYTPTNAQQGAARPGQQQRSAQNQTQGFYLGAGYSFETAAWEFSMKSAGSKLIYDNLSWHILDVNGGYAFGEAAFGLKIDLGLKFGFQANDGVMTDDDITAGGYLITTYYNAVTGAKVGDVIGRALSIGTSSGGSMFGYNVGFGLTDKLAIGRMKITPSIGYRDLSYTVKTQNNHGMAIDTGYCVQVPGSDEVQCDPFLAVLNPGMTPQIIWEDKNTSGGYIDTGGTYYYMQPGTSHKYDVSWAGPYLAVDLDYDINADNKVSARVELGLPAYTATGDQPYRPDWKHPKSIEDSAGIGSSYHLGLAALWSTGLTDSVSLQIGLTYDYYTMSGATAKTFLNGLAFGVYGWPAGTSYDTIFEDIVYNEFGGNQSAALDPYTGSEMAIAIQELRNACPGWVCSTSDEVDSFYRSMGIRVGIAARF